MLCHAVAPSKSEPCGHEGACDCAKKTGRRRALAATVAAVSLLAAPGTHAMPSPTNAEEMEARKDKREQMLKEARAKAAAQAAAQAPPAEAPKQE